MEYDKYHSLVNVVDKNINIAFVHRELLAPNNENKIKIPILIKNVEEELTTAKVKLSFDPNMVKMEDICAPLFEDNTIKVHLLNKIDNQEGKIEIEAVISDEEDVISEKKGTISDNTLFAKMLKEDEEENIAPIAYLIVTTQLL